MKKKTKDFFIKRVVRARLPETNSSSSHSVTICTKPRYMVKKSDEDFDLDLRDDGVLYISKREKDFGWEWEKYNNPKDKLWYVCGILFQRDDHKSIKILKDILKSYTGAKDVVFEWMEDRKQNPDKYDDYYTGAPSIDHNSSDIFEEIVESKDAIKNFIFNRKSWLYLGNDNSYASLGFYEDFDTEDTEETNAVVSLYFGNDLGRVDVEINDFPECSIIKKLLEDDIVPKITYKRDTKTWLLVDKQKAFYSEGKDNLMTISDKLPITKTEGDDYYLVYWVSKELRLIINNILKNNYLTATQCPDVETMSDEIKDILERNKDQWVAVKAKIVTNEFGEL